MSPKDAKLLKRAQALDLSGRAPEAAAAYREFLKREPGHAEAWAAYAGQLLNLGRQEEARKACDKALAIDPRQTTAQLHLGTLLLLQERMGEAESRFQAVLQTEPTRLEARLFLAVCLLERRNLEGAFAVLGGAPSENAVSPPSELASQHGELWTKLGTALFEARSFQQAEAACRAALERDPRSLEARAYLGSSCMAQGDLEGAAGCFRRLVTDHPRHEQARLLLITCLARRGDPEPVCQEIDQVLRLAPTSFLVHKSVMGPYYSLGCWAEYAAEIERFRKVEPSCAFLDFEQSFLDLLVGDMRRGWEHFEARLRIPKAWRPQRTFGEPAWQGEPFAGRTLLLWPEQGLGDTLMALRYLPRVKALGGRVILETQPGLRTVAETRVGADLVISTEDPLPAFDLQASLMSLPWIFQTGLESIPAEVPYLDVPGEVPHRLAIQEALDQAGGRTRVGLVWAGGPGHDRDFERSLPASALAPLAALPGVAWYSLQVGNQEAPPLPGLVPLAPLLGDFSDTAFALRGLDQLITVDTSVAHLAGALGIPTLLLLAHQPDYRWMLDRPDSPWYPTLRLYRQPTYGDWGSVIRQVAGDLASGGPQRAPAP